MSALAVYGLAVAVLAGAVLRVPGCRTVLVLALLTIALWAAWLTVWGPPA